MPMDHEAFHARILACRQTVIDTPYRGEEWARKIRRESCLDYVPDDVDLLDFMTEEQYADLRPLWFLDRDTCYPQFRPDGHHVRACGDLFVANAEEFLKGGFGMRGVELWVNAGYGGYLCMMKCDACEFGWFQPEGGLFHPGPCPGLVPRETAV